MIGFIYLCHAKHDTIKNNLNITIYLTYNEYSTIGNKTCIRRLSKEEFIIKVGETFNHSPLALK